MSAKPREPTDQRESVHCDAVVYVDSTFDDDVTGAVLASLRPVSVAELAAAIPLWVQELTMSSGFVG